jgi:hypothetical protein
MPLSVAGEPTVRVNPLRYPQSHPSVDDRHPVRL